MIRRPPRSTRTDTLFPYTTLFRSRSRLMPAGKLHPHRKTCRQRARIFVELDLGQVTQPRRVVADQRVVRGERGLAADHAHGAFEYLLAVVGRSEGRSVGKEGVSTGRSGWSPTH